MSYMNMMWANVILISWPYQLYIPHVRHVLLHFFHNGGGLKRVWLFIWHIYDIIILLPIILKLSQAPQFSVRCSTHQLVRLQYRRICMVLFKECLSRDIIIIVSVLPRFCKLVILSWTFWKTLYFVKLYIFCLNVENINNLWFKYFLNVKVVL